MIQQKAPDFELMDQDGRSVKLYDLLKSNRVVLYFYPMSYSPACIAEAIAFRDYFHDFEKAGAAIVGVSKDQVHQLSQFCNDLELPFFLLSDDRGSIAEKYKIGNSFLFFPTRKTFVIEQDGTIIHEFKSLFNAKKHAREALKALAS